MSKYNEVMDRIELTEDMQSRILKNIDSYQKRKRSKRMLRYIYALAACLILAAGIIVIVKASRIEKDPDDGVVAQGGFECNEFDNIEKLSAAFGFEMADITDLPFAVNSSSYCIMFDDFAQIDYYGKNELERCCIRIGKDKNDISGDYEEYSVTKNVTCDSKAVTFKGNGNKIFLASWVEHGRFCSVSMQMGATEDEMLAIIRQVITGNAKRQ